MASYQQFINQLKTSLKTPHGRATGLILVLLFTLPFGSVNPNNVLVVLLFIHSLVYLKKQQWIDAFKSPIFLAVGGFYILHVLNLFHANEMAEGVRQLEIKAPFFLASLLMIANKPFYPQQFKRKAQSAFLYGTLSVSLMALLVSLMKALQAKSWFFFGEDGVTKISFFTYQQLSDTFSHPAYFSLFVGFAIFIGLQRVFASSGKQKLRYLLIAAFLLIMMILLQGRMNILALLGVFGISFIYYAVKKRMYLVLAVPVLLLAGLVVLISMGNGQSKSRFLQMPNFDYDITGEDFNSATYRLAEWTCALDVIQENFWFGTGVGDNRKALIDAYKARGFKKGVELNFIAHNQYIETMIACGLVGLLALLFMLSYYGKLLYAKKDFAVLACLIYLAFCMLTESMFERSLAITLFSVFFPLMLLLNATHQEEVFSKESVK